MERIRLNQGEATLVVAPGLGGSILQYSIGDADVFRRASESAESALETACFPLVPFCNRIPNGRFQFEGRTMRLPPNFPGSPHTLHGHGWREVWSVEDQGPAHLTLSYEHQPDAWPWRYRAVQRFELEPRGLHVELTVINLDAAPMPAGLGLHPYFPMTSQTQARFQTDGVWMIDQDCLPTTHVEGPWERNWSAGAIVRGEALIDNCFTGWRDAVIITGNACGEIGLTASPNARWLHLYIPPGEAFFCAEPTTNRPDPFGAPGGGMAVLLKDQVSTFWMDVRM